MELDIKKEVSEQSRQVFNLLARLLDYPDENLLELIKKVSYLISVSQPVPDELLENWQRFASHAVAVKYTGMQEVYTATFDLNPVCSLYISIGLFGEENFNRSLFMARMVDAFNIYQFPLHPGELPDSLPVLLKFMPFITDHERRESFIRDCILAPAQECILKLSEKNNPYSAAFRLIVHFAAQETNQETAHV